MRKVLFLILVNVVFVWSCQKNTCSNSVKAKFVDATGTDGCGMVIELDNGKYIEPKNLDEFKIEPKDGEKIWVSYHAAQSGGTVCMIGDVVIIDCISKR